jgi:hypothetical protein
MAIFMIMLSMFVVLPPVLILSQRSGLLPPYRAAIVRPPLPRAPVTAVLFVLLLAAAVAAGRGTGFDYNFRNLQFDRKKVGDSQQVRDRQNQVYAASFAPGAVYVVDDFPAADRLGESLAASRRKPGSTIGRVRSLRDLVPPPDQLAERRMLLVDLSTELAGRWTERVKDADQRQLIDEFRAWKTPPGELKASDIPESVRRPFFAKDGSGKLILTIHPSADRKDARNAMAFASELYALPKIPGVVGPVGETVVFAEILRIVLAEGPKLVLLTLLLVFAIVFVYQRSLRETLIILFPLVGGVVFSLGILATFGLKLNFFNIVVIPSLLGMGVDSGVHYFRRWCRQGGDVAAVQKELFEPMTIANWTTAIGFGGMLFANHPGIRSIGLFAVIGCLCAWVTNLFLFPGILSRIMPRRRGAGGGAAT